MEKSSRLSARAVIVNEGDVLLIKRIKQGDEYWVLPGGGVEIGELPSDAIRREVSEETGLLLSEVSELGVINDSLIHLFLARPVDSQSKAQLSANSPESKRSSADNQYILEWVPISQLSALHILPENLKGLLINLFSGEGTSF